MKQNDTQPKDIELKCTELKPMTEWLEKEQDGECRPCVVAALISHYQKTLHESNRDDLAERFETIVDDDDPVLKTVKVMDEIKATVDEQLREDLLLLDCMAQTNKLEEEDSVNQPEQYQKGQDSDQSPAHSAGDEGTRT